MGRVVLSAVLAAWLAGPAAAATLDFSAFEPSGYVNAVGAPVYTDLDLEMVKTKDKNLAKLRGENGSPLFVYNALTDENLRLPDAAGGFCALEASGRYCVGDAFLAFGVPVEDVTIGVFYVGDEDRARVTLFGEDGGVLAVATVDSGLAGLQQQTNLSRFGRISFAGIGGVAGIGFEDLGSPTSTGNKGVAFGDIDYDVTVIPLPAGAGLLLTALGAFGAAAWHRRRNRANTRG